MSVKRGAKSSVIELRDSLHWWARPQILSTHILAARSISSRRRSLWILAVFNVSTSESLQFSPFCKSYNWLFFGKKEGLQYLKNTTKMSHSNQWMWAMWAFKLRSEAAMLQSETFWIFSTTVDRLCFVVGKLTFNFGFVSGTGKQKFYDLFASFPTFYGKFFRAWWHVGKWGGKFWLMIIIVVCSFLFNFLFAGRLKKCNWSLPHVSFSNVENLFTQRFCSFKLLALSLFLLFQSFPYL